MEWNEIIRALREDREPRPTQTDVANACHITQRKLSFTLCKYYNASTDYILSLRAGLPYPKRKNTKMGRLNAK